MQKLIILAMLLGFGVEAGAEPRESFVAANGVRLHFLDFGGTGPAVILLHGQGNTAHIFRTFAPGLIDRYRVVALTRRGHGQSEAPTDGYDPHTLAADIREAMDALRIERAVIIGHSMAGEEMTALAASSPQRVTALVYLDAALDRFKSIEDELDPFLAVGTPQQADRANKDALRSFERRWVPGWTDAHERDFEASVYQNVDGTWALGTKPGVAEKIDVGRRSFRYDYARLSVPALGIYATPRRYPPKYIPPDATPAQLDAAQAFVDGEWGPFVTDSIAHFRREVPCARILEIPDADHYVFFSHSIEVLTHVRAFLAEARCP
jgi:pimeloyl-ACP methyl ester carboxylesterase